MIRALLADAVIRAVAAPPMRYRHPLVGRPVRPIRRPGWRERRACRRDIGHCWHAEGFTEWWCCACGADTEGMPVQFCRYCREDGCT